MYQVRVNKYSHEGSGFCRLESEHETLEDAQKVAAELVRSKLHRFVYVADSRGIAVQESAR